MQRSAVYPVTPMCYASKCTHSTCLRGSQTSTRNAASPPIPRVTRVSPAAVCFAVDKSREILIIPTGSTPVPFVSPSDRISKHRRKNGVISPRNTPRYPVTSCAVLAKFTLRADNKFRTDNNCTFAKIQRAARALHSRRRCECVPYIYIYILYTHRCSRIEVSVISRYIYLLHNPRFSLSLSNPWRAQIPQSNRALYM